MQPYNDHTKPADRLRPTRGKRKDNYQLYTLILMGLTVAVYVIIS